MADWLGDGISRAYKNKSLVLHDIGLILPKEFNAEEYADSLDEYFDLFCNLYLGGRREVAKYGSFGLENHWSSPPYEESYKKLEKTAKISTGLWKNYFYSMTSALLSEFSLCDRDDVERVKRRGTYMRGFWNITPGFAALTGYGRDARLTKASFLVKNFRDFPGVLSEHVNYFNKVHNEQNLMFTTLAVFKNPEDETLMEYHDMLLNSAGIRLESFLEDSSLWR